eukprot:10203726-Heterocapsa_arctica.AAC.1
MSNGSSPTCPAASHPHSSAQAIRNINMYKTPATKQHTSYTSINQMQKSLPFRMPRCPGAWPGAWDRQASDGPAAQPARQVRQPMVLSRPRHIFPLAFIR